MVQKEEQEKKLREEMEKQLIEQEAQRLRLEMAEQRQRDEDLRRRFQNILNFVKISNQIKEFEIF